MVLVNGLMQIFSDLKIQKSQHVPDEPPHPILVEAGVTYLDIGWRAHSPTNSQGILNYDLRYILNSEENKSEEYWTVKTNILADEIAQEDVGLIVESSGLYDLKYRIQGLTEGQSYLVQLRSSNENGYSYWSNASSMSTLKNNVPKQLDPPVLVLAGTDFLDVGWKLPPAENTEGITRLQ